VQWPDMTMHPRTLLASAMRVDRSEIQWSSAIRGSVVVGILAALLIGFSDQRAAIPIAVGALFAGVAEMRAPIGHRWRTMLWASMWLMVGNLVGGLVAPSVPLILVASPVAAFLGGFAPAFGRRAGLIGLLALVVFTIAAGTPLTTTEVLMSTLLMGLGGVVQTIVVIAPYVIKVPRDLLLASDRAEFTNIRAKLTSTNPIFRHAVRLSIALTIGTALSHSFEFEHSYWIPMSIAWMSRPYPSETVVRVTARLIGTVVGVVAITIVIEGLHLQDMGIVAPLVIGSLISLAFIWADYAIAVAGITVVVISLFTLNGDPVIETAGTRILATIVAAVIVCFAILIWRTPEPDQDRSA
jgi:hypothetical protein